MKLKLLCAALCALCTAGAAGTASAADFTTSAGYNATCSAMAALNESPATLADDDQRVAFVICSDTKLMQQIATWFTRDLHQLEGTQLTDRKFIAALDDELDYAIGRMAASREVLEKIDLGKRKSLRLVPSQWQLDLDGDGKISTWEKYFFAIPKRRDATTQFAMPSNEEAHYMREYNLDAAIKVDQSDVLWALSYHDFIESALVVLRALDMDEKYHISVKHPELFRRSRDLFTQGLANSEKTRRSVLAETGNDEEWIPNPKQTNSAFPLALDAKDFSMWGKVIKELQALEEGKTLLARGDELGYCPKGFGLDVREISLNPPQDLFGAGSPVFGAPYCRKIDKAHPVSPLVELMSRASHADPQMRFLRYLLWIN